MHTDSFGRDCSRVSDRVLGGFAGEFVEIVPFFEVVLVVFG
jgi:hypothetical protein